MRSLWIATLTASALVPAAALAQAPVARSGAISAPGTFAGASAGPRGAFSRAQSAPPRIAPVGPRGNWSAPRGGRQNWNGNRNWNTNRNWNVNRNGTARSWSQSQSRSWTGPRGSWNGRHWAGGSRWGGRVDGRWHGGFYAPGGWNAYRQPVRGWVLPNYWFTPGFFINDFSFYGLGAPPAGYNWSRYYDDAVLVDGRGRVFDSVSGIDWNRYDGAYAYDDGDAYYAGDAYDDGDTYYADGIDDDYAPRAPGRRRDDGVGGAVIGGVVGGVAGNVIAGRGNRLAGTVIGAGVGAVAGAAIDRAEDRGRRDDRGAPYPYPGDGYAARPLPPPPPPPGMLPPPPPVVHHGGGYETRVYQSGGYGAGYGYYGGTTTTVTVMPTTTETIETVTYYDDAVAKRRVYHAPVKRRPPTKVIRRSKILSR